MPKLPGVNHLDAVRSAKQGRPVSLKRNSDGFMSALRRRNASRQGCVLSRMS